ncbi:hypothetical protein J3S89_13370 [Pinisolibacter sp. B13]|uniref:ImmA/IrrE family metallo-endopeptidase n=1 Tax=Pinisolibacter aquiterrae TaxID=2815579 RepID=UPI001C3D041E|nr:ImmA/IrrE family metallo-endopeptidase [Pinisolibacter aquiterrae]MBV5265039.1 hypothetical protein [Pinisolibacter aquiterrae]
MRFSVEWLEGAPNRAPEERATAAELQIWLGDSNAALHFTGERPGSFVHMPVYTLAEGLALDWWRLFGSREEEISLKRYRSGYAVPDVRMRFDGAAFEVHAEQSVYRNPDVRFWAGQSETLNREEAEATLGQFIETVLERLQGRSVEGTTAALRWARVCASRGDPEERAFCEAAAALGEDPYAIANAAAKMIDQSAGIFKDEALTEFLAGARGKDAQRLLAWIDGARQMPNYIARLGDLPGLSAQAARTAPAIEGEPGWARGYRRARACRAALGLADADRVKTYKQLAKRLGNAHFRAKSSVDGIRVLREDDNHGVMLHLRSREGGSAPTEQLFSFARGVGDVACFPEPDIAPVNDLLHAYRQSCGRAFAAELLAPIREVCAMWEDGRDCVTIADEFGVGEMVIEHQLENKKRIEQACAA